MKKTHLYAIVVVAIVLFASCGDKSCLNDFQYYENSTKTCECLQRWPQASPPELDENDYNLCETVFLHFNYLSIDNKDYPYYSCAGDTVLFCGFLNNSPEYTFPGEHEFLYLIGDDSTASSAKRLTVRCKGEQLADIDFNEKCFVTGTLSFGYADYQYESFPGPGHCLSPRLFFDVIVLEN